MKCLGTPGKPWRPPRRAQGSGSPKMGGFETWEVLKLRGLRGLQGPGSVILLGLDSLFESLPPSGLSGLLVPRFPGRKGLGRTWKAQQRRKHRLGGRFGVAHSTIRKRPAHPTAACGTGSSVACQRAFGSSLASWLRSPCLTARSHSV